MELTELHPLLLVQDGPDTLLRVANVYKTRCTAQVVIEGGQAVKRDLTRIYAAEDARRFRQPTKRLLERYRQIFGPPEVQHHDYEPGQGRHPMQTDPLCDICGQPKKAKVHP